MGITTSFIHSRPQREIASLLKNRFAAARKVSLVSGFLTPDGAASLKLYDPVYAAKIDRFVIGAGTFKAFEAVDRLIAIGKTSVRINLGYSMPSGGNKHPFKRYRPMLHSKIYYFDNDDGTASAFVGSHNMTGFALNGLNGEAGVLIEGDAVDQTLYDIRQHIGEAWKRSVPYVSSMKDSYTWWTKEYFDGLSTEANDAPRDAESRQTIILVARLEEGRQPNNGEFIYFELERELSKLNSVNAEVHLHLFRILPPTPEQALAQLDKADWSFACTIEGLDNRGGNIEVQADWHIDDRRQPLLKPTTKPFRPKVASEMQQVRARVQGNLPDRYNYLFDGGANKWTPDLDPEESIKDSSGVWRRVRQLVETDRLESREDQLQIALRETSPESGSFVLFSRRRRRMKRS